ncbi:winged helix-turn-helix domain-containing protein [Vibrio splendidus]|uniref:winged helix-turn-helix domain-containing protein n=1 Tax=Vibrio splendidus TaxID=29497 RepID=UPI002469C3B9|nr:winged helix-turn-helix domain-containing protein [Vibrio splendidus]MDH5911583.1 winged helix-turn-helix domain-containing protein [Vibrio splendidus]MDH5942632.1 winged helix-turn-helix domain-containing protein [Vibrio splendidus]MDH5985821.1 winged helix-turn-helix domain-containing protein [Vibrio splendidus]MDH5994209.1 winged helix-turn-helix domain-containing protein [Vibrio splendidus]MDH6007835.1 winged helix-turn-helix domain-containing protein [Vibrio splendidus]
MKKERIQYSFDVWLFIPDEDKLIMNDEDVIIDNRLSKLLNFFCQNPKIVFSRDELINEVWNGSILTDQVITQAIFELRKILKAAERHSMGHIITVPKRGYKLDVDVHKTILVPASVTTNTVSVTDMNHAPNAFGSFPSTQSDAPDTSPVLDEDKKQQVEPKAESVTGENLISDQGSEAKTVLEESEESSIDATSEKPASQEPIQPSASKPSASSYVDPSHTDSSTAQFIQQSPVNKTANDKQAPIAENKPQKRTSRAVMFGGAIVIALGLIWWMLKPTSPTSDAFDLSSLNTAANESNQPLADSNQSTEQNRLNQTADSQNLDAHKAHESVHYLSLEPRYIYVSIDDNLKTDAFKRGIIHKLMSYLTTYRDFRVVVDETLVPNSANVISFKSEIDGDREYLDITYFNRISNFRHLGRDYLIDPASLHTTMRSMLDDLLDSFNLDIQKSILKQQISELPKQEEALKLTLEALGLTFMTLDRTDTLSKIAQANELEPDNHFVMSNRYMYELADIFIMRSKNKNKQVEALNKKFKKQLLNAQNNANSYRVYDALAAYFLTEDNPDQAEYYLSLIPRNEYSVMSMIILAKIEESQGNPSMAEEYYYEAILESGHPVVLKVAQTLFFKSNITEIESKLGINQ